MILKSVRVRDYKNITDSSEVELSGDVTCFVGKNESGKTAFLEAVYRLNPLNTGHPTQFAGLRDFPRQRYGLEKNKLVQVRPIIGTFELEKHDVEAIEAKIGAGVVSDKTVTVSRRYDSNVALVAVKIDEAKVVKRLVAEAGLDASLGKGVGNVEDLRAKLGQIDEPSEGHTALGEQIANMDANGEARKVVLSRMPRFLYFDDYNQLPSRISIPYLNETGEEDLEPDEQTALTLLHLASANIDDFDSADNETRVAALEAAASALTSEVFTYWTQNKQLRVKLGIDHKQNPEDGTMQPPFLDIRIENLRHNVSLNFGERSSGFQWFFSFLTAFSEYRDDGEDVILLLDEPGMGLHAAAQADFLRYIDEQLSPSHKVLYTTHSPFMVDATQLDRVRLVEDKDVEGTIISDDVLGTSRDTVFPIQAALGYELTQSLFVGPDNLVVEGPSDLLYLTVLSEHLGSLGRTRLDDRWAIVPVGGMQNVPTFIALLGSHLNVSVLVDGSPGGMQRINNMIEMHVIDEGRVLAVSEFAPGNSADIEDLFEPEFYIRLVAGVGIAKLSLDDLGQGARIVKRVEKKLGNGFDHYQPSAHLLKNQGELLSDLDDATLDRFEQLIQAINGTLL